MMYWSTLDSAASVFLTETYHINGLIGSMEHYTIYPITILGE